MSTKTEVSIQPLSTEEGLSAGDSIAKVLFPQIQKMMFSCFNDFSDKMKKELEEIKKKNEAELREIKNGIAELEKMKTDVAELNSSTRIIAEKLLNIRKEQKQTFKALKIFTENSSDAFVNLANSLSAIQNT